MENNKKRFKRIYNLLKELNEDQYIQLGGEPDPEDRYIPSEGYTDSEDEHIECLNARLEIIVNAKDYYLTTKLTTKGWGIYFNYEDYRGYNKIELCELDGEYCVKTKFNVFEHPDFEKYFDDECFFKNRLHMINYLYRIIDDFVMKIKLRRQNEETKNQIANG
jgi:hypothetical protein